MEKCTIAAEAVALATEVSPNWLDAENEEEFNGRGVSICPSGNGFLFGN